jgi:hypothetical protein
MKAPKKKAAPIVERMTTEEFHRMMGGEEAVAKYRAGRGFSGCCEAVDAEEYYNRHPWARPKVQQ